jgi:hypothetical protein
VVLYFLDSFEKLGLSKAKGKPLRNDVGENTRNFQNATHFFYIEKQDEIDFIYKTKMKFLFYFEGRKQNLRGFLIYSKPRVLILQATLCSDTIL